MRTGLHAQVSAGVPACLCVTACLYSTVALAQQEKQDNGDDERPIDEIIVTGSRIPRSEFTSPSPIQVLDTREGQQIGVSSVFELVQRAPVVNGTQVDSSLNTAAFTSNATEEPPPGGVGSSNISLRGLAPERTLVLLNGRRLGSTGVRGAPSQPDISLIPISMVERVEILTEGVAAVYGADAVAGVINVILRDEFDGVDITANAEVPGEAGGEAGQLSVLMGTTSDRGSFQFGAEIFDRKRVTTGDRDWARCLRAIEQIEDGRVESVCRSSFPDNQGFGFNDAGFFVYFHTPGESDTGIPNWSTYNALPFPDHPLITPPLEFPEARFQFNDFHNDQDERRTADLVGEIERFSAVTTGKLLLDWLSGEELYFESFYLDSHISSKATTEQIFPTVLAQIPQETADGNIVVDTNGTPVLVDNPLSPFPFDFLPVLTLDSVPQHREIEREQSRFVLGLRGDIGESGWRWDASFSHDRGIGFQAQPVLFEPHLQLALQNIRVDAGGDVICGVSGNTSAIGFGFITAAECVPIDFSNPELYTGGPNGEGIFSDAEEDFLVGNRTNRTVVEQTMFSAYTTGNWFEIGSGRSVGIALGAEYRLDEITSQNSIVGVLGLNAAENPLQEGSTAGNRDIFETFFEVNVPLYDELDIDAAIRYTNEENFGAEVTWRGRFAWRPADFLSLSGSVGTSYRAPNLREQFLDGQGGGVSAGTDPCTFRSVLIFVQNAGGDATEEAQNLTLNCELAGVQMADLDGNGFLDTSLIPGAATIPTGTSGNANLRPETSTSWTGTLQISQPWTDKFDFDIAISYWDIAIENTVEEQEAGFILNECYRDLRFPGLSSPLCDRHSRNTQPGGFAGAVDFVDISFINIGEQAARGFDINTRLAYSFLDLGLELAWSTSTTRQLEQSFQAAPDSVFVERVGEIGWPEWRSVSTLSLLRGDWEVLLQSRYVGEGMRASGPGEFREGVFAPLRSRPVVWARATWYNDLSLTFGRDKVYVTAGVSNLFDEPPPLVSFRGGPNRNNAVTSSGYDLVGRTFFATVRIEL